MSDGEYESDGEVSYSFLTTNYDKADVLERSLVSMLRALPAKGELIVVDGGSTDDSRDVLDRLSRTDDRLRVLERESNTGEGRQLAFEHARGQVRVQQLDTDRVYDPVLKQVCKAFAELDSEYDGLVLATLDSLYLSRRAPIETAGGYPPLGRVDERVLVERLCTCREVTFRVLPVEVSRELPTADTATALGRARKWRRTARDLLRVGFTLPSLFRYNHGRFSPPKAILSDLLCLLAARGARRAEPIATVPGAPRGPDVIESWQAMLTDAPEFLPDGERAILSPADLETVIPGTAWIDLGTVRRPGTNGDETENANTKDTRDDRDGRATRL